MRHANKLELYKKINPLFFKNAGASIQIHKNYALE